MFKKKFKISEVFLYEGRVIMRKSLHKEHPLSYESLWLRKFKSMKDFPKNEFYEDYEKSLKIRETISKFSS